MRPSVSHQLSPLTPNDVEDLRDFLVRADLTTSALDDPNVRLWIERDEAGEIVASTGFELDASGEHVLLRSVAIAQHRRGNGYGIDLGRFTLERAAESGATTAWLFSRRSGPFWQKLGFASADRYELAEVLHDTHQVRQFVETDRLDTEVAWSVVLVHSG